MRILNLPLLILAIVCTSVRAGADEPAPHDVFHLILLAPAHPVFIRLQVQADGAGLRGMRARYASRLFRQYDSDNDGFLTKAEAGKIPPLVKAAAKAESFTISDTWVSVDANPADDRVSLEELVDFLDRVLGSPLSVSIRPKRVEQSIDMFGLLDRDRDGRLSLEELDRSAETLRRRDVDDDESFSIEELTGIRGNGLPLPAAAVPDRQASDLPILDLNGPEALAESTRRVMERYSGAGGETTRLSRDRLGLTAPVFSAADSDGDGGLNAEELQRFLVNPVPHLMLGLELFQSQPGKPRWTIIEDQLKAASRPAKGGPDQLTLAVNGISLELKAISTRGESLNNRKFFQQRFRETDADKNKYLNEQEFSGLMRNFADAGMQQTTFDIVDRDADKMVTLDELLAFIDQDSAAQQSRVDLVLSHDGKSVFQVLDAAPDRRLTRRELLHAAERMRSMDLDRDGTVTSVEMVGRYKMQAELGRPALFRTPAGGGRGSDLSPVVTAAGEGPKWFQKMDRNRDGDVSRREFLGSRSLFEKLDADGDGLISASEAEAVPGNPAATETASPQTPVPAPETTRGKSAPR